MRSSVSVYTQDKESEKKYFHGLLQIRSYLYLVRIADERKVSISRAMNEILEEHQSATESTT